jgi:murein DD-endopeptidase MepM/ murein hydrolase activator NlpD
MARDKSGKLLLRKGKPYVVKRVVPGMGGYGHFIEVRHSDGYTTLYGHLRDVPSLKSGTRVKMGQEIGILGKTGNAETMGSHVHFEVHDRRGYPIDPALWISGHAPVQQ